MTARERLMAEKVKIGGIIQNRDLARIGVMSIPDRPGVAAAIFGALGERGISCAFIVHTIDLHRLDNIVVCIARRHLPAALRALEEVKEAVGAEGVVYDGEVGMVSIFGPHFGERSGIAGAMFAALAAAGINILAISTSISSLSCVVDAGDMDRAVRALQESFDLP